MRLNFKDIKLKPQNYDMVMVWNYHTITISYDLLPTLFLTENSLLKCVTGRMHDRSHAVDLDRTSISDSTVCGCWVKRLVWFSMIPQRAVSVSASVCEQHAAINTLHSQLATHLKSNMKASEKE